MSEAAQELEMKKNTFYRDHYRRTMKWLVVNCIVTLGLVVTLAYLVFFPGQPKYYATTTSGEVIQLHSLSEPVLTSNYIMQWASIATRKAFNLDYVHYQQQLDSVKPYFTSSGFSKLETALQKSGLLKDVVDNKLIMTAVVSGTPVILNREIVYGRYTWRIQMPVLLTFQSASEHRQMTMIVTMNVQRVSTVDAAKGIQISDFAAVNANE